MADIFDRCLQFKQQQRIVEKDHIAVAERILFTTSPIENAGPWIEVNGERLLQFSSNDYLGISLNEDMRAIASDYVARYGVGAPMGARPLTGTTELHLHLEQKVAEFKRCEASLTFNQGAGAMMGAIACLARPGDLILLDLNAHASLVYGARLSGASIKFFRHNDVDSLERQLKKADSSRSLLIVVDGVYSMGGDIAPLADICDMRDKYGARMFEDDAHGTGIFGDHGRGVAEFLKVEERIDLHAGTFSKAFGTHGGFVAGDRDVIYYMRSLAPTYLFTKATSIATVAATLKSLEIVQQAFDERGVLWENTRLLHSLLRENGYTIGLTASPITPITTEGAKCFYATERLRKNHNIWVSAVASPAVRRGREILRITANALHTEQHIRYLVSCLNDVFAELGYDK